MSKSDFPKFPKCNEILQNRSKASFLKELDRIKLRLEDFKYTDQSQTNILRQSYIQFIYDADEFAKYLEEVTLDILDIMDYYEGIKEYVSNLAKVAKEYTSISDKVSYELLEKGIDPLDPMAQVKQLGDLIEQQAKELKRRKANLDKAEEEIAITEGMLAKKKSEMEEALRHRYMLTDAQKQVLLEEKDLILDGIEEWGSIYAALQHNPKIKSKQSTIQMYIQLFPEFGEAIKVSKALFKDRLEGIMVERALEGTENPVFGKGEYIGDYKIKDNKMLLELMKAKVPEEYNKKSTESVKNQQINNMNIISFANIDETKDGFTKDVGVVLDVDETGKVERIQQEKKMIEYYKSKDGAEIIAPEEEK